MYVFQVAALDEDTQKQGLHLITHRLFSDKSATGTVDSDAWMTNTKERDMVQRFFTCTPVRCSIIHINTPTKELWAGTVPSVIEIFGADERARIQFHQGEFTSERAWSLHAMFCRFADSFPLPFQARLPNATTQWNYTVYQLNGCP